MNNVIAKMATVIVEAHATVIVAVTAAGKANTSSAVS
jgi:hypothetical protein